MSRSRFRPHNMQAILDRWLVPVIVIAAMALTAPPALAAKGGDPGKPGGAKAAHVTTVKVTGTISNKLTGAGIPYATVTFTGGGGTGTAYAATTDSSGSYAFTIPADSYTMTAAATNFNTGTLTGIDLQKGGPARVENMVLAPVANVVVKASYSPSPGTPGSLVTIKGSYTILDGSTFVSATLTQSAGVPVSDSQGLVELDTPINGTTLSDGTMEYPVTLGSKSDYKTALVAALGEPPMTVAKLPSSLDSLSGNITNFHGGIQNRWQVAAVNAKQLEVAQDGTFVYTVTTSKGGKDSTYTGSVEVDPTLPWGMSTGLQTVPKGVAVLLYGKTASGYDWKMTSKPAGNGGSLPASQATLEDWDTQAPYFTPDVPGAYVIDPQAKQCTAPTGNYGHLCTADSDCNSQGKTDGVCTVVPALTVYAGVWSGAIDPDLTLSNGGTVVADTHCTGCHSGGLPPYAPDMFTPWLASGHPQIFQYNLDVVNHELANCDACHTLGFNLTADNNGFDDQQPGYDYFDQYIRPGYPGAWLDILSDFSAAPPDGHNTQPLGRFASVQCESCHGPQDLTTQSASNLGGSIHGSGSPDYPNVNTARVSLSASVCGSCHGEPTHHARFQEWQISGHGNYSLAEQRGTSSNCTRCHSGDGFVLWTNKYQNDPSKDLSGDITWNVDTVQPQSCQTCHDPHSPGTDSGAPGDGDVRVSGSTPLLVAGFSAPGVGKGAVCMLCHNSRGGVEDANGNLVPRTDTNWPATPTEDDVESLPHHSTVADLIEGRNAYFVAGGTPGKPAAINNTCVTCHMDLTEAPTVLNNPGATNHTFNADPGICFNCHGNPSNPEYGVTTAGVQSEVSGWLDALNTAIVAQYEKLWADSAVTGLNLGGTTYAKDSITKVALSTYHGESGLVFTIAGVTDPITEPLTGATIVSGDANNGTSLADLMIAKGDAGNTVFKATWNYWLVAQGGGMGVHNHAYSVDALTNAVDAVNALP